MFKFFNPNPCRKRRGDCSVRAVSLALGVSWEDAYWMMAIQGAIMCDMPSGNDVWGEVLIKHGYVKRPVGGIVTAGEFADDHPSGRYVLGMEGHVAAVIDGVLYDIWDSGDEIVTDIWEDAGGERYAV